MGSTWAAPGWQKEVNWHSEKSVNWASVAAGRWKQQQTLEAWQRKTCAQGDGKQSCNLVCSGLGRTAFGLSIPAQPWGCTPTSCPRALQCPLSSQHPSKGCGCAGSAPSSLAHGACLLLSSNLGSCGAEPRLCRQSWYNRSRSNWVLHPAWLRLLRYSYSKVL